MPLDKSGSRGAFKKNVRTLMGEVGKSPHVQSRDQALAISYAIKRRGKKRRGYAEGGVPLPRSKPRRDDPPPMVTLDDLLRRFSRDRRNDEDLFAPEYLRNEKPAVVLRADGGDVPEAPIDEQAMVQEAALRAAARQRAFMRNPDAVHLASPIEQVKRLPAVAAGAADPFGAPSWLAGKVISPEFKKGWRDLQESDPVASTLGSVLTGGAAWKAAGAPFGAYHSAARAAPVTTTLGTGAGMAAVPGMVGSAELPEEEIGAAQRRRSPVFSGPPPLTPAQIRAQGKANVEIENLKAEEALKRRGKERAFKTEEERAAMYRPFREDSPIATAAMQWGPTVATAAIPWLTRRGRVGSANEYIGNWEGAVKRFNDLAGKAGKEKEALQAYNALGEYSKQGPARVAEKYQGPNPAAFAYGSVPLDMAVSQVPEAIDIGKTYALKPDDPYRKAAWDRAFSTDALYRAGQAGLTSSIGALMGLHTPVGRKQRGLPHEDTDAALKTWRPEYGPPVRARAASTAKESALEPPLLPPIRPRIREDMPRGGPSVPPEGNALARLMADQEAEALARGYGSMKGFASGGFVPPMAFGGGLGGMTGGGQGRDWGDMGDDLIQGRMGILGSGGGGWKDMGDDLMSGRMGLLGGMGGGGMGLMSVLGGRAAGGGVPRRAYGGGMGGMFSAMGAPQTGSVFLGGAPAGGPSPYTGAQTGTVTGGTPTGIGAPQTGGTQTGSVFLGGGPEQPWQKMPGQPMPGQPLPQMPPTSLPGLPQMPSSPPMSGSPEMPNATPGLPPAGMTPPSSPGGWQMPPQLQQLMQMMQQGRQALPPQLQQMQQQASQWGGFGGGMGGLGGLFGGGWGGGVAPGNSRSGFAGKATGGSVDPALAAAYRIRRANGGEVSMPAIEDPGPLHEGAVVSDVPGRTDKHNIQVRAGSYVLPSSHVASLAQDNTIGGFSVLDKMFSKKTAPGSVPMMRGIRGPNRKRRADGGMLDDGMPEQDIPIVVAGGEYIVSPEHVAEIGGGDLKHGHEVLDEWVKRGRKKHISELQKLPGPAKT